MSMYRILTAAAGLFFLTPAVHALGDDYKFYVGLDAGRAELEIDTNIGDLDEASSNFGVKFGREIVSFLSVEAHAGLNDKGPSEVYYGGIYARAQLPFERLNIYALVGGTFVDYELETPAPNRPLEDDEVQFSYGVGIDFFGNDSTALYLQAMRYGDDIDYRVYSVGIVHRFDFPGFR